MMFIEVHQDLFTVPKDYCLVHCISADFALGAGIAKEFAKRGVKEYLLNYSLVTERKVGKCIVTFETGWRAEFNLITKEKYWQKPTYDSLKAALKEARVFCLPCSNIKLAMPRIGCGLDRLQWCKVKQIIEEVFSDTDVEILVCSI